MAYGQVISWLWLARVMGCALGSVMVSHLVGGGLLVPGPRSRFRWGTVVGVPASGPGTVQRPGRELAPLVHLMAQRAATGRSDRSCWTGASLTSAACAEVGQWSALQADRAVPAQQFDRFRLLGHGQPLHRLEDLQIFPAGH